MLQADRVERHVLHSMFTKRDIDIKLSGGYMAAIEVAGCDFHLNVTPRLIRVINGGSRKLHGCHMFSTHGGLVPGLPNGTVVMIASIRSGARSPETTRNFFGSFSVATHIVAKPF